MRSFRRGLELIWSRFCLFSMGALMFLSWSSVVLALSPSPEELLEEARKGRVEMIKIVSDVTGKVDTIPKKEELFPYLLILDDLAELEAGYGLETMGQSVVKLLGFAITKASTKWMRLDADRAEYVETFMKYADNNVRSNLAEQQDQYLINDPPVSVTIDWVEKSAWAIQLAIAYKSDFSVILAFEDFQAVVVKRAFANVSNLKDEEIELIISKVSAIAALNEVDAYMQSLAASADSVEKVLRSLRFACIFDRSIKQNPRAPMTLLNAAANSINDALQRLVNLRGAVSDSDINQPVSILPSSVVANISSLIVNLSDRLVYQDQLPFLLSLATALSRRLGELGMSQQQVAIDAFASRIKIMMRIYYKRFEGTYGVQFDHLGGGTLTILHTGGGRLAATMSIRDLRTGLEIPFSVFYFEYNEDRNEFQSTQHPFDNTEGQIRSDYNVAMYFKLEENSNCMNGSFGNPMVEDTFRACLQETVTSFDRQINVAPRLEYTSSWRGLCAGHDIHLRMSQVGRRLVGSWADWTALSSVAFNFGISNPVAHSAILTSGGLDVDRFAQARVLFISDDVLEVEYIVAGRGIMCHTRLNRIKR